MESQIAKLFPMLACLRGDRQKSLGPLKCGEERKGKCQDTFAFLLERKDGRGECLQPLRKSILQWIRAKTLTLVVWGLPLGGIEQLMMASSVRVHDRKVWNMGTGGVGPCLTGLVVSKPFTAFRGCFFQGSHATDVKASEYGK